MEAIKREVLITQNMVREVAKEIGIPEKEVENILASESFVDDLNDSLNDYLDDYIKELVHDILTELLPNGDDEE
jgi:hypothetical protein